jgi:hypothetical protein
MTFILLTGAGFSYNWGGPLASDVFSALLADTSLDTHARDLLFDSGGAFEKVPADLRLSADPDDQRLRETGMPIHRVIVGAPFSSQDGQGEAIPIKRNYEIRWVLRRAQPILRADITAQSRDFVVKG